MSFLKKLFRTKDATPVSDNFQSGGFELLRRMTAGSWSKGKMLATYEKSLYVMACVSKIATKVACTDFQLFQIKNSKGDTKEILNHPLLDLIYKPNPFQTKTEFLKKTIINKLLSGDAFWYKVRNSQGKVQELWNLRPDFMTIVKDPINFIKGYEFTKENGVIVSFLPSEIIHFKGVNPLDEYYGTSVVRPAQTRIDTEEFASGYQRDFFLNNARPDGIIKSKNILTDLQRSELKDSFEKRHKGLGKNSMVSLFEGEMDYQQISISQREMDFIESMKFTRDDILVAFSVPKPIVAITDDVNLANAETAMRIFLSETVEPEISELFEKANEQLTYPDFGANLMLDYEDPTPENREKTLLEYTNGLTNGWLMINEVRAMEGKEPIQGGWTLYKPFSDQAVGGLTGQSAKMMSVLVLHKAEMRRAQKAKKIFRGKKDLLKKFIIAEEVVKAMDKFKKKRILEKPSKKSRLKKKDENAPKEITKLIVGEGRKKYFDLINKRIDNRSSNLKGKLIKLNNDQGKRLLEKLSKIDYTKSKAIGSKVKKAIETFYLAEQPTYTKFIFPFIENYAKTAGKEALGLMNPKDDFIFTEALRKSLVERSEMFGLSVNETTRDNISRVIENGIEQGLGNNEISDNISMVYDGFSTARADTIARTETTAGNNEGTLAGFKQSTATHKEWIAINDDRTRESHADIDGEVVALDEDFSNGLSYPGDAEGDPEETINCRCVIAPAREQ